VYLVRLCLALCTELFLFHLREAKVSESGWGSRKETVSHSHQLVSLGERCKLSRRVRSGAQIAILTLRGLITKNLKIILRCDNNLR